MEDDIPVDVDLLAEKCGIPVHEDSIQGFLGLWLHVGDSEGIVLAEGQSPRRRRFTLAHELGHACLPTHRKSAGLKCLEEDLAERD
ncbi:MAG TPA: ImmA/IrrE family metallo-endopeptidase, partial [Tepidiformaceae bacterium]|nr:ImmA/IrrE family metallo-endopeptidase [Tepidiformaceae bacterium]